VLCGVLTAASAAGNCCCCCCCCVRLEAEAESVGFPLLVKAVSGGGGKGMKLATKQVSMRAICIYASRYIYAVYAVYAI
jgi:biotin carboxylase